MFLPWPVSVKNKMNKYLSIFSLILILFTSNNCYIYANVDLERRNDVLAIIDQEIREVERLKGRDKSKVSDLDFRRADLYLEKGRLIKEGENEDYLNIQSKVRAKTNKKVFFRQSYRYYLRSKEIALGIIKANANYNKRPEIYYVLGFHEKEFGKLKEAVKFFKKSESLAPLNGQFRMKPLSALAEIAFNEKDYSGAEKYYEFTLPRINDRWWTKDAYNLSWCYYKQKKYSESINKMKEVIRKSKDSSYVDMGMLASKDLGLFYAESGRIEEGVKFFKSQNRDVVLELITLGGYLREQGNFKRSLEVYNEALDSTDKDELKAKVYYEKIMLSEQFGRLDQHYSDSFKLYEICKYGKVTKEFSDSFVSQLKKYVTNLQKKMNKNQGGGSAFLDNTALLAEKYFLILKDLDKKNESDYLFYSAESQFQAKNYSKSAEYYRQAFDKAKASNNLRVMKLSAEGLLASLGPDDPDFKNRNSYYEVAYKNYLEVDASSKKSQEIYKRLFRLFYDQGNTASMNETLRDYIHAYGENSVDQDKMVASLLAVYQKKKQNDEAAKLVDEIQSGRFFVSNKLKGEVYGIGLKMKIGKIEGLVKNGDYVKAKAEYELIYKDKKVSKIAKSNAAFNLMVISYKSDNYVESYKWSIIALDLMTTEEVVANLPSFIGVTKYLFERLQIQASADLGHRSLLKVCNNSPVNLKKLLFNNSVINYRASSERKKLDLLIDQAKTCGVDPRSIAIARSEYLDHLVEKKYYDVLENEILKSNVIDYQELEYAGLFLEMARNSNQQNNTLKWIRKIETSYQNAVQRSLKVTGKNLDSYIYSQMMKVEMELKNWSNITLRFPENTFNELLNSKAKRLEKIVDNIIKLQKIGSRQGVKLGNELMIYGYLKFAKQIKNFTPANKSSEYVQNFMDSMKSIYIPLTNKAYEIDKTTQQSLNQLEILANGFNLYPVGFSWQGNEDFSFVSYGRN